MVVKVCDSLGGGACRVPWPADAPLRVNGLGDRLTKKGRPKVQAPGCPPHETCRVGSPGGHIAGLAMAALTWGILWAMGDGALGSPARAGLAALAPQAVEETKTPFSLSAAPLPSPKAAPGQTSRGSGNVDPLFLQDPPEPLVPLRPRSEAESDRVEALALFSCARLHELRDEDAEALRLYQRAFRCDPQSVVIARAIISLSAQLDRHLVAVRYALKLAEIDASDPELLGRLGVILGQMGQPAQAIALLEKAAQARGARQPTARDVDLWLELGRMCCLAGQYAKAATWFGRVNEALEHPDRFGLTAAARKALLSNPDQTYELMGETFLQAGQLENARHAFQRADAAAARPARRAWQGVRVALRSGNAGEALDRLEEAFRCWRTGDPVPPEPVWSEVLRSLHQDSALIPRLEKLRAELPENVALGYFLADAYRQAGRWDSAEALYRASLARLPHPLGYRGLAEIYRICKQYDKLLETLGQLVAREGSLEPLGELGKTLSGDKALVQAVVEQARQRLQDQGRRPDPNPLLAAAFLAAETKGWDDAQALFDRALAGKPERAGDILLSWGLGLILDEQYARAIAVLRRGTGLQSAPELAPVFFFYLAGCLEMAGKTEEALAAVHRAIELSRARDVAEAAKDKDFHPAFGETPRLELRRAWILSHARRYREATQAYQELIRKYDSQHAWPPLRQVLRDARLALSNLMVLEGDVPAAEQWLEQVLDEFPDDASALNDLGYLWADAGKHLARAERMIRRAVEQEPDNAAFRDSLGWVLFRRGRVQEALPELEKAAAAEPDPTVLDHLGDAYWRLGRRQKARSAWERAAKAYRQAGEPAKAAPVEKKLQGPSPPAGGSTTLRFPNADEVRLGYGRSFALGRH